MFIKLYRKSEIFQRVFIHSSVKAAVAAISSAHNLEVRLWGGGGLTIEVCAIYYFRFRGAGANMEPSNIGPAPCPFTPRSSPKLIIISYCIASIETVLKSCMEN